MQDYFQSAKSLLVVKKTLSLLNSAKYKPEIFLLALVS